MIMVGGDEEGERAWEFVSMGDGTAILFIPDGSDKAYSDGMSAAMELYPSWVIVDQGEYGLTGQFVTLSERDAE